MLHLKKTLLVAAGLAASLAAYPVLAQDAPQQPQVGQTAPARQSLEERLNLNDEQKPKVHPILNDAETQLQAIMSDDKSTPDVKRQQAVKLIQGLPDKVNPYLDKTQQATLAAFVQQVSAPQATAASK